MHLVKFIVFHIFIKLRDNEINQFMLRSPLLTQHVQILVLRAKMMEIIFKVRYTRNGSF